MNQESRRGWTMLATSFTTLAVIYGVWYSYSVFLVAFIREFGWSRSLVSDAALAAYYDAAQGRPGCPPQLLVRMLYLEFYANLSDRQVAEQVGYDPLYREFVGLSLEEPVPDDTTLVLFRQRVGAAGLRSSSIG
jgi:hypothetical protein